MNRHLGMCDASCAVPLSEKRFLVADDEINSLAVYGADESGPPIQLIGLDAVAGETADEMDIEGATLLDGRAYWISSHGRTAKGKKAAARHSFFASVVRDGGGRVRVDPCGKPVTGLVEAILEDPAYRGLGLHAAARRAPKEDGGLNIEGLAPARGGGLLIGFRSPLVKGLALIAHLENPVEVIEGETPRFGPPRFLDLGGLGIRSLEAWGERGLDLVVAGPVDGGGGFQLYAFNEAGIARVVAIPEGFAAEAVITFPVERSRVLLLSDDGSVERSGVKAKKLPLDDPERYFRSLWVRVD